MDVELDKDIVLFTKYIRKLGVKYPGVYISGFTGYDTTSAYVQYHDCHPKTDGKHHLTSYIIKETGKLICK